MPSIAYKSCFISAPFGVNTHALVSALQRRNVACSKSEFNMGNSIIESVLNTIKKSDFICAIVNESSVNNNVLFEIGIATGLNKPVLILIDPQSQKNSLADISHSLSGLPHARLSIEDQEALDFHLNVFLAHRFNLARNRSKRIEKKENSAITNKIEILTEDLERLPNYEGRNRSQMLEEIVFESISSCTESVIAHGKTEFGEYDLAFWLDSLEVAIGNPILVEVKSKIRTLADLDSAASYLRKMINDRHGKGGLVVYETSNISVPSYLPGWPLVFVLSAKDLLKKIREDSLSKYLIARRNELFHGIGGI